MASTQKRLSVFIASLFVSLLVGGTVSAPLVSAHAGHAHTIPQVAAQDVPPELPTAEAIAETSLEPTPEPTVVPVDTIFIKPQQPERIKVLLKLYQDQVEKYAASEREYRISKAQFQKLNTLQSLEEAIVKTREVMLHRDDVLITYSEMVRAHLQETDGVEISLKTASDTDLETLILALKEHHQKLEGTQDRDALKQRVLEFIPISQTINNKIYTAIALISLGDLQTVYDRSLIVYREIRELHAQTPTSALRQEERNRAYREVDLALEGLRAKIETIRLEVTKSKTQSGSTNISSFQTKFNSISASSNKVLDYLKELLLELT